MFDNVIHFPIGGKYSVTGPTEQTPEVKIITTSFNVDTKSSTVTCVCGTGQPNPCFDSPYSKSPQVRSTEYIIICFPGVTKS